MKGRVGLVLFVLLGLALLMWFWIPGINNSQDIISGEDVTKPESVTTIPDSGLTESYESGMALAENADVKNPDELVKAAWSIDSLASLQTDEKQMLSLQKRAEDLFKEALKIDPDHIGALNNLALIEIYRQENVMGGVQKLLKITKLDPNNEPALYQLGILAIKSGQTDKAIERFEKLVSLQPQNKEYHKNLALLYNTKGDSQKAGEHAAKAKN